MSFAVGECIDQSLKCSLIEGEFLLKYLDRVCWPTPLKYIIKKPSGEFKQNMGDSHKKLKNLLNKKISQLSSILMKLV